jgi:OmcA/MtrC family decaheme c-type cytochrome
MRRLIILLAVLTLAAPLMFYGCSGDDGSNGAPGATGPTGPTGPPGPPGSGVVAQETCVLCHDAGKIEPVAAVHNLNPTTGAKLVPYTVTAAITGVTFTPSGDNVVTAVTFTFATADATGTAPAINLLDNSSATQLRYVRFSLSQLIPGTNGDPNEWEDPVNNSRVNGRLVAGAGNSYTYTFPDNAVTISGGFDNSLTTRAGIQISSLPVAADAPTLAPPVANPTFDLVPNGSAIVTTKNDVTTAACNGCHDPLAIHGGGRREIELCVICHNPTLASGGGNLGPFVHKIHTSQDNTGIPGFSAAEVTYPQAVNNCLTCHKGTDDYWKTRPAAESCGSCHTNVNFTTGTNHLGGAQDDNSQCALCHNATQIPIYHAAREGAPITPDNPVKATPTLAEFEYGINSVTVDNTTATIKFWIKKDGVYLNMGDNVITRPANFSGGPSFLFAFAAPQDGVSTPADYNNYGNAVVSSTGKAGQPVSLSIIGLPVVAHDNAFAEYTVTVANAFPANAKMRAVALQGYFTQIDGGTIPGITPTVTLDNVGRHTIAAQKPVTGDAIRRVVVKSGYVDNTTGAPVTDPALMATAKPQGCLECHEVFEGHGGNRLNNVQVCVMCHNPNLSSSARTFTTGQLTNPDIIAMFGTDPLTFPEVTNDFKELIHGLHSAEMRVNDFVDIRNRAGGTLVLGAEITYPGDLMHCTKCHTAASYQNIEATNFLLTTEKITTGNPNETVDNVIAARNTVPNSTDLVNTPNASACGYCHDSSSEVSHFLTMGGKIKATRGTANVQPPELAPVNP